MGKPLTIAVVGLDESLREAVAAELAEHDLSTAEELDPDDCADIYLIDAASAEDLPETPEMKTVVVLSTKPEDPELTEAIKSGRIARVVAIPWRAGELAQACWQGSRAKSEIEAALHAIDERFELLAAATEIGTAFFELSTTAEILVLLTRELNRGASFDMAAAMLSVDDAPPLLHLHAGAAGDDTLLRVVRDRCLETFRERTGRAVAESQLTVSISGASLGEGATHAHLGTSAEIPLVVDGTTIGLLLLTASHANGFDEKELQFAQFLADRASSAVRRHSERSLDERKRLALMVNSTADGLILTDFKSDNVLINPAARRLLGIDSTQVVTQQFLKDKLGFYPFDLVTTRIDSPGPLREELTVGNQTLHSVVSPVHDSQGRLVGVVISLRDFTETRELARRQEEFVSVVSHELRTPLTSITGALDIALSDYAGRLNEKQRRYLTMARESCGKLNEIVDDLLDVARSERGRMQIYFAPLALDELGREVIERFRPAAQAKGIRIFVKTEQNVRIAGDPDRLTQVLNNLLSNAIKFTPRTGLVEVEIFGPAASAGHVGVSIYNNGEPIPAEAAERIFEKFEQLKDSATRKVGGTGLGLAISRAIIEAHGGRIWVEPRDDGTRFVFTLPVAPEESELAELGSTEVDLASPPAPTPGRVVLLVDDDSHTSDILKGVLMAAGHEILVATDSEQALMKARARSPALAVVHASSDPEASMELVKILKHDPDTRKASVLVVSKADVSKTALGGGADEFLPLPLEPAAFHERVAELIQEAGRGSAHRILIVDDDSAIRAICREVLENVGYAIREAGDGLTALKEAHQYKPDLILLDVMMPDLDGFETAERLREDPSGSMAPIIFLSAKGETADKVRAFRLGAEDYIVKPFVAAELAARVGKAVERRERQLGASPTTQLPGPDAIEAAIERRLEDLSDVAFCYLDLDNLKAFNDYYGYAKADGVIRQTGDLIRDVVKRCGRSGDFIGHIAGDDFVFITDAEVVDEVCATICQAFDRLIPLYYNRTDRERGFIETKDRYSILRKFPVMTVSVAAVTSIHGQVQSYAQLAEAAARGKNLAKAARGSSYVRDGKVLLSSGGPPRETEVA